MTFSRIATIVFYQIVDMTPSLVLAIVPFENKLRFSIRKSLGLVILLYILVIICRIGGLSSLRASTILTVVWIIFYFVFYRVCIQAEFSKLLFILLIILNYNSFNSIFFSYFAYGIFSKSNNVPYSFHSSLILCCISLATYPFMYWIMKKKFRPLMNYSDNKNLWNVLWLVPAIFCLSYYYNLYSNGGVIVFSKNWSNLLFSSAMNIGSLFVTYIVAKLVEENNMNLKLKIENYQLMMQTLQYENLKERMEETRRARHDLRQNIAVIQSYLDTDNKEALQTYIRQYLKTLPPPSPIIYCDDYALNALIVYYADMAREQDITFQADVQYSADYGILDSDIVILYGNLLENAVEACSRQQEGKRFIRLCIKKEKTMLITTLDNSYDGMIQQAENNFLSSKRKGTGIGINSVQKIAEKYHGITKFEYKNNIFYVSVMLTLPPSSDQQP